MVFYPFPCRGDRFWRMMTVDDAFVKKVAILCSDGYTQKEMAVALSSSQSTVSRALREARSEGLLQLQCTLPTGEQNRIRAQMYTRRSEVYFKLRSLLPKDFESFEIHVINIVGRGARVDFGTRRSSFSSSAAALIRDMLPRMSKVGVAWGRTVAAMAKSFARELAGKNAIRGELTFFPLCGEPMDFPVGARSASSSARRLQEAVTGDAIEHLSLGPTPARIPAELTHDESMAIRTFLQKSQSYVRVFDEQHGLARNMDTALISGGTFASATYDTLWLSDTLESEGIEEDDLSRLTVGDVAGAFLPRRGLDNADASRFEEICSRWTGVSILDLYRCSQRAAVEQTPGVVMLATGQAKAAIVLEAVSHGIVNRLIIDSDLADSILDSGRI